MSECPWCGAKDTMPINRRTKPHYAEWACLSRQRGDEPVQSTQCELNVVTAQRDELLAACEKAMLEFNDGYTAEGKGIIVEAIASAKESGTRIYQSEDEYEAAMIKKALALPLSKVMGKRLPEIGGE